MKNKPRGEKRKIIRGYSIYVSVNHEWWDLSKSLRDEREKLEGVL